MTKSELFQQSCERSFDNRLARLVRFRQIHAPWSVIAMETVLMVKALTLHPLAHFWHAWETNIRHGFRLDAGWCAECDTPYVVQDACPNCVKRFQEETGLEAVNEEPGRDS